MADHFTLDVDPGELRKVAGNLETLRTNVMAKGTTVTGTPEEIGEGWKGDAATNVKAEMTTLGSRMTGLGGKLFPITEALRELAGKYDVALEKLPDLNRRWNAAQTTYDNAVAASEQQMDRDEDALRDEQGRPNRFLQHEIEGGHTNRVSAASTARQNTQDAIQAEYDEIVDQLELDTAALGTTLNDQTPVTVTEEQIEAWQSGSWPEPDMTTLLTGLDLTASRQEQEERERLTPQVEEDVEALQDALEDGDQDAINEALEALGEHADDDVYTDILVDQLGVDGVQDLYLQIDESLTSSETDMETLWPALEGFNDAIANGISQRSDEEMAPFVEAWMDADYGAKMWALVTASDNADGRVNAVALAYQSEIYNAALSNAGSMPGLFPQVFNYAYGDEDMLDRWDDRSSGEDLARILQHADSDHVDDLLFRLTNVQTDGGTMREEDFQHLADLWGETVQALRDDWAEGHANGDAGSLQLLMRVLEERNRNVGYPYGDMMTPYVTDIVNDPNLMDQILKDALDGRLDASDVSSLINDSGVKVEDLIAAVTQHQLESGETAEAAAENIGALLRAGDVIDASEMDWSALTQSMATEALGMAADAGKFTPGGPLITLFEGLYEEIQRQQEAGENWDEATGNSAAQQIIAFSLYTQHHGVPDGFEDYAEQQEGNVPPSEIVTRYLDEMRARGGEDWEQMRLLLDTINDTRDDT